ncbi:hypothetical protein HPB47_023998, partial [Ixodes persulcatus]
GLDELSAKVLKGLGPDARVPGPAACSMLKAEAGGKVADLPQQQDAVDDVKARRLTDYTVKLSESASATRTFETDFVNNPFGYVCDVCERLWHMKDLTPSPKQPSGGASSESGRVVVVFSPSMCPMRRFPPARPLRQCHFLTLSVASRRIPEVAPFKHLASLEASAGPPLSLS